MIKLVKYFNWELKNEFIAGAYFSVILLTYCITLLILGIKNVNILVILEMFLTNYVLSILQRFILEDDKEYSEKIFILRASFISVISIIITVVASILGGWFDGLPLWVSITIYVMLIISYLTVWIILKLGKKYDTQKLNEQLKSYKKNNKF